MYIVILLINAFAISLGTAFISYAITLGLTFKKLNLISLFLTFLTAYSITSLIFVFAGLPVLFVLLFVYLIFNGIGKYKSVIICVLLTAAFMLNMMILNSINFLFGLSSSDMIALRNTLSYNIHNSLMFIIMSVLISFIAYTIISKLLKRNMILWTDSNYPSDKIIYIVFIDIITTMLIVVATEFFAARSSYALTKYIMLTGNLLTVIFVVHSIISICLIAKIVMQASRAHEVEKNKEITDIYRHEIRNIYEEIRDFKHDYIKIYYSMNKLIDECESDELKDYFTKEIAPLHSSFNVANNLNHYNITYLNDSIIQGLLYSYAIRSIKQKIVFITKIPESINYQNLISSVDLSRCLGILLDNAFEASVDSDDRKVSISIVERADSFSYIIKNTYDTEPDIIKMRDLFYSSKGYSHGRGLAIITKICNHYNNMDFNFNLDGKFLVCVIKVYNPQHLSLKESGISSS